MLLPGITTLARAVAGIRQEENERLYAALYQAVPHGLRTGLARLLEVPGNHRVSELERLRTPPRRISKAMQHALERAREVRALGAGAVDAAHVPAARMTGLARYGLTSKAPTLRRLEITRQTATLLATVRHLETATVDDALDLLHVLMATKLLAKAERLGKDARLKMLPQLRKAAKKVAAAVDVLMSTPPATEDGELVSVADIWSAIEQVVPRDQLADALSTIAAFVPEDDGDGDAEWRAELVARYGTVRGFIRLLVDVIHFGAVEASAPVVGALSRLPELIGRKRIGAEEVASDLVTGSWRRLVFASPAAAGGTVDKAAYSFCILEHLHRALPRRDVFAKDATGGATRAPGCWPASGGSPPSRGYLRRSDWRPSPPGTWPSSRPCWTPPMCRSPTACREMLRCRSATAR